MSEYSGFIAQDLVNTAGSRFLFTARERCKIFHRPLYKKLISSRAFRRLDDIRFLGAIDYFVRATGGNSPKRRHTRSQHTLGVGQLALQYAAAVDLSLDDEKLLVAAALLHDIGHAPLSHSMEPAFKQMFGQDHHLVGQSIILDQAPSELGAQIYDSLQEEAIDPNEVVALIDGNSDRLHLNRLFSHPLNLDTIEAICRSETYFSNKRISPSPYEILEATLSASDHKSILDYFWELKGTVYDILINGSLGILADNVALSYFKENSANFSPGDFYRSERSLRRKHPGLFQALRLAERHLHNAIGRSEPTSHTVNYIKRRFLIDTAYEPYSEHRYIQSKVRATIEFSILEAEAKEAYLTKVLHTRLS